MPFSEKEDSFEEVLANDQKANMDMLEREGKLSIIIDSLRDYLEHETVEVIWRNIEVVR